MKYGFYPALGTPVDENGDLVASSLTKHVEDQVDSGAAGLLVMGTMGMQPCIKDSQCPKVAEVAAEAAGGRCPVFVGVMDNSIARVLQRIEAMKSLKIDGVVLTTPYYFTSEQDALVEFFSAIAARSSAGRAGSGTNGRRRSGVDFSKDSCVATQRNKTE